MGQLPRSPRGAQRHRREFEEAKSPRGLQQDIGTGIAHTLRLLPCEPGNGTNSLEAPRKSNPWRAATANASAPLSIHNGGPTIRLPMSCCSSRP